MEIILKGEKFLIDWEYGVRETNKILPRIPDEKRKICTVILKSTTTSDKIEATTIHNPNDFYVRELGRQNSFRKLLNILKLDKTERTDAWIQYHVRGSMDQIKDEVDNNEEALALLIDAFGKRKKKKII